MKSLAFVGIYLALGSALALVLARRETSTSTRLVTASLALFAWPLWAPIASFREGPAIANPMPELERRIHASLDEALAAVRGSTLAALLPESTVHAMRLSVSRASARVAELELAVTRGERQAALARRRVAELESSGSCGRSLATARVQIDNLEKLAAMLRAEREALADFADLCDALRSQLVLARYAGSSLDGVGELVSEIGARVEGLDSALAAVVSDAVPA